MLRNLKESYTAEFSAPRTKDFVFFTSNVDNFLFKKDEDVEIFAASTVRTMAPVFKVSRNLILTPFYVSRAEGGTSYIWSMKVEKNLLTPGFYDIQVSADLDNGRNVMGYCTFGYDVEHMLLNVNKPEDFDDFWKRSMKKLENVELDVICGERTVFTSGQIDDYNLAEASLIMDYDPDGHVYEKVESYEVSFMSVNGLRIHGWFARPVTEEKCPAMLILPGAGFNHRSRPLEHARHGYAALDIQVHGQPLDGEANVPIRASIDYGDTGFGQEHYYNDIYLHCIQAVNYLCSREDIDHSHIIAVGGSQGGRLSITTAALDKRITAVVAGIVHYANLPYIHWADDVNRRGRDGSEEEYWNFAQERVQSDLYYDVANFAKAVTCPVLLNGGLIDRISPPEGVLAVYQGVRSSRKKLVWLANIGHDWSYQFDTDAWKWLKEIRMEKK